MPRGGGILGYRCVPACTSVVGIVSLAPVSTILAIDRPASPAVAWCPAMPPSCRMHADHPRQRCPRSSTLIFVMADLLAVRRSAAPLSRPRTNAT